MFVMGSHRNNLIILLLAYLLSGCANAPIKSPQEKIKALESRARSYQTLSDIQRLSPPYSTHSGKGLRNRSHNEHLRMTYLNKAKHYRKLADEIRKKKGSDSNRSVILPN